MKRVLVLLIALLLLMGCSEKESAAPQVQMDARAEARDTAAPAATAAPKPTAAPEVTAAPEATEAPTQSTDAPAEAGFVAQLTERWAAEGSLEGLYPFPQEDVFDYYGIDLSRCLGGAVFADAVGYTNEAIVVEAQGEVLDEVETLLVQHLEELKAQFRGYDPEALALAEKAVLVREGDAVLFVISPNAEAMLAAFRALMA